MSATKLTSDNLARELLGLPPSGTELPQPSADAFGTSQYGGANVDSIKTFAIEHKKPLLIGGGVLLLVVVGALSYHMYQKKKNPPAA